MLNQSLSKIKFVWDVENSNNLCLPLIKNQTQKMMIPSNHILIADQLSRIA